MAPPARVRWLQDSDLPEVVLGQLNNCRLHGQVKLPPRRLPDNHREGGLADQLLLRITCEMAIYQQLSED